MFVATFDADEFVKFFSLIGTVLFPFVSDEGDGEIKSVLENDELVTFFSLATVLVLLVSVVFVALDFVLVVHSGEGEGEINSVFEVEEFVKLFATTVLKFVSLFIPSLLVKMLVWFVVWFVV